LRVLLDTSVLIARERRGLGLDAVFEPAVSAVTIGELSLGVELARGDGERAARAATLAAVEDGIDVLDVDLGVGLVYGRLVGRARRGGRRPSTQDALIAATAVANDLPLLTQDVGFLAFDGLEVVLV
jgi:tRNA(fMet)-specific endonuclease VapC